MNKQQQVIPTTLSERYVESCAQGNLAEVKNLLPSVSIKNNNPKFYYNQGFIMACQNGQLDVVKFLLKNPQSLNHINMDEGFYFACENGQLNVVSYLCASPELKNHIDIKKYNDDLFFPGLQRAAENGHLNIIQYLLTSPELKIHANIHFNNDVMLTDSCQKGYTDIVKYLTSSPDLSEHSNFSANYYRAFSSACFYGHFEIVKHLLTFNEIKNNVNVNEFIGGIAGCGYMEMTKYFLTTLKADINYNSSDAFQNACQSGDLNMVKYLTQSPELFTYCDIYMEDKYGRNGFIRACNHRKQNVIEYLLFDLNFQVSKENIKNLEQTVQDNSKLLPLSLLNESYLKDTLHLIEKRDLFLRISEEFTYTSNDKVKRKI